MRILALLTLLTLGHAVGDPVPAASGSAAVPAIQPLSIAKFLADPVRPVVYAINQNAKETGEVLEINPLTRQVIRAVTVGKEPSDLDLTENGDQLVVINTTEASLSRIDLDSFTVEETIPLEQFSNRNNDIGGHVKCGKGAIVYYVDEQWGPRLRVFDTDTRTVLQTFSSETGSSPDTSNNFGYGDINLAPDRSMLFGWGQYGDGAGSAGTHLVRFAVNADGTLSGFVKSSGYSLPNFTREPFNTPILFARDGSRMVIKDRVVEQSNLDSHPVIYPDEIYATNHTGDLAVGESAIWWGDGATEAFALPFASKIAAFSANDAYLVRFDPATRTLHSTAVSTITDLPGPWPRPGQVVDASPTRISWSPVDGATSYRVFIAADADLLAAMSDPVATVTTNDYDLPDPLVFGRFYTWRADAVTSGGTTTGKVNTFGIGFPQAAALPNVGSSSSGIAASLADRHLLLGFSGSAQVYDFNPATGSASPVQTFAIPGSGYSDDFGKSVAMDGGKAAVGFSNQDNPANSSGAAYVFKRGDFSAWEHDGALALPSPVANEAFGTGVAASGNMLLVGTGNTYNLTGRVAAFITEPETFRVQSFSANDGVARDSFGYRIAMEGNHAIISAPGNGSSYNRLPCLYAFNRSPATGQWTQGQKIVIPGASTWDSSGKSLALAGNLMATRGGDTVVVFTRNQSGQWVPSATIARSSVSNSSSKFGNALAIAGDQLFVGDTGATHAGVSGGVVFSFRRSGSSWVAGPVIVPSGSHSGFGAALSARDHWLVAAGGSSQPAWIFQISASANQTPRFNPGLPTQVVAGRAFSTPVHAGDADGNAELVMDLLQGPAWLSLSDNGNGEAALSGTPGGVSGSVHEVQIRVRDNAGAQALHTYRLSTLAATDLPVLTVDPAGSNLGVGQEMVLRAAATGIGPFHWQWYRGGEPISGANSDRFVIGEVALTDAGSYSVRVSNVVGEDVSAAATVDVHPADRFAGDWPTFGGSPAHTGHHPAALDTTHFIPAWTRVVQGGFSLNRAAIAKDRAFVVPVGRFSSGLAATALDLQTGSALWSFPFPGSNSSNPPSVFDDRVYFQRGKGTSDPAGPQLFSLNAETGELVWAASFGAQWEEYEAPAVTELGVFINGGAYGGMYGFDLDGSQRFFRSLGQYDSWAPTIANDKLYSWVAGRFIEHNPNDGSALWTLQTEWSSYIYDMDTTSCVAGDTAAIYGCYQSTSPTELICVDLPTRSIRWRLAGKFVGSPAISDGRIFGILGNAVTSYALADGTPGVVYQTSAGTSGGDLLIEQAIVFNDRLVVSNNSRTWVFNLEDGQLLQTLDAGGRLSYSNGFLLAAGNDGTLRAFRALHYNANLAGLSLSAGTMLPDFETAVTEYIVTVPFTTDSVTVTPSTELPDASVTVNGTAVAGGTASGAIDLAVGNNTLTTEVTAEDGITTKAYVITVTRLPLEFVFNSGADIPVTANGFATGGHDAHPVLKHAPVPGAILTMVNNTGLGFIHGAFGNLAQGQQVTLEFGGTDYQFVVNYYGGSGNDLVLQWAATRVLAWGDNGYGQLGDGSTDQRLAPTDISDAPLLAGKAVTAVSSGYLHGLALCADGTLAAWGYNVYGQLGTGGTDASSVPVGVDRSGALAGRTVVAISAGPFHNLALCSDGAVIAWGYNNHGQLGTGNTVTRRAPALVEQTGALAGKHVVAVAAAAYHSFALCSDGTVAAWGYNDEGELGDGTTVGSTVPVSLDMGGALSGKRVAAISAGQYHTLARCTDGTVVAWGYNARGQLGDNSTDSSSSPVDIGSSGVLAGRSVVGIRAGGSHSLALCSDGTLGSWGDNRTGQLGGGAAVQSEIPVAVDLSGIGGRTVAAIAAGRNHNLLRFADGGVTAWGDNSHGQLGNGGTMAGAAPSVAVATPLDPSSNFMFMASGSAANHSIAVIGVPASVKAGVDAWLEVSGVGEGSGDLDDPEGDGIPNIMEYAFGLDPMMNSAGGLPRGRIVGGNFMIDFIQPAGVSDILYGAEWSTTLEPGSWQDVPDGGAGDHHIFSMPVAANTRLFMRLKVTRR